MSSRCELMSRKHTTQSTSHIAEREREMNQVILVPYLLDLDVCTPSLKIAPDISHVGHSHSHTDGGQGDE